jgi:hypothetical protein
MTEKITFERFGISKNFFPKGELELKLRSMVYVFRASRDELASKIGLPWKQRLRAWKHGFNSTSWLMCNLEEKDPDLYLSDLSLALNSHRINGFFNPIIGNKLVLSRLLDLHRIPHPVVVSIILEGRLLEDGVPYDPDMETVLSRTLDRHPRQIFRPTWAGAGAGVFFLCRDNEGLKLNGKQVTLPEVCSLISNLDRYLSTEFVEQAAYARNIYPGSTNTLRILSLFDVGNGDPFVAAIVHRFGSSRSAPIDNWHQGSGGVCAAVDLNKTTLGQALSRSSKNQRVWHSCHPETREKIEGVAIPGLDDCIEGVLNAASHLPFCPLIGWDVVVTENGYSILEANTIPGLVVLQAHTPLLKDPRTRAFFRRWGLVAEKAGL